MPTLEQVHEASRHVDSARERLRGQIVIDYVLPDYYARQPKACMGGWGRQFLNITPSGEVLPCHAAQTIPGLVFESVRHKPLGEIWASSPAFERFRGTDWMPDLCRTCDQREVDWGGCRCQALAVVGDAAATDPPALSPGMRPAGARRRGSPAAAARFCVPAHDAHDSKAALVPRRPSVCRFRYECARVGGAA
jgi:pyrroloquinoline quinone biosynthesis protein E